MFRVDLLTGGQRRPQAPEGGSVGTPVRAREAWIKPDLLFLPQDLTGGAFEDNLRSLHLQEGRDFLHFS